MQIQTGIITISDRALTRALRRPGRSRIEKSLRRRLRLERLSRKHWCPTKNRTSSAPSASRFPRAASWSLTTGGTGVALRDVTPEAVREIAIRELPGFGEAMRMESLKITKNAILSRNLAAVVDKTLVICLPGKPGGAVECLGFVVGAIPHCVEVLSEVPTSC